MSEAFIPMSFVPEASLDDLCANERAFITNETDILRYHLGLPEGADFDYSLRDAPNQSVEAYIAARQGTIRLVVPAAGFVALHEVNREGDTTSMRIDPEGKILEDQQLTDIEKLGVLRYMHATIFESTDRAAA